MIICWWILDGSERSIADGIRVLGHSGDNITSGGQLLAVLAGIGRTGDAFKAIAGAAAGLAADENDFSIIAAKVFPVGNLAGIDIGNLLQGQVAYGVRRVYDNGNAIVGQNSLLQAGFLFLCLQCPAGKADVAATFLYSLDAGTGSGGIVGKGNALVFIHKGFAQRIDDLLHRGRAISGNRTGQFTRLRIGLGIIVLAAAGQQQGGSTGDCH